jgi:hypothetical protein
MVKYLMKFLTIIKTKIQSTLAINLKTALKDSMRFFQRIKMFKTVEFESYIEEVEFDLGEQEFIIVLVNGEEHTLKYRGVEISSIMGKDIILQRRTVHQLNMYQELTTLKNWIPIRLGENGQHLDVVPIDKVLKIKTGAYSPYIVRYTETKERAVEKIHD